ncbi:Tetratricopeptide repeat protein 21B [Trichinella spiralis]|uniref:Tetratricopeptide repeat protein 21B n=1 Tax=Trichinella spiralis TaxID=6334 RepID=A0ABR3KPF6_TRISP
MSSSRTTTKLEDYQNKLSTMRTRLSSYMKELERAREELSSPTLVRNLLDLLIPYWDRACQLVEKYENTLPIGKPADDIIEWHNFVIEVTKARSIAQDYLKKDKVDDDRRDMKQNSGARYHLNLPKVEESVSMDDHKPSSNVTFIRRKSPPRNRLPSVAALHAETRSFEGFTVCGERHRRQGKTYVSVASKGDTREIDARKPNDVITLPVGRRITNCYTVIKKRTKLEESHSKYEKLRCVNFRLKGIYGGEDSYPIEALCLPRITTVDANPSAANWHHLHGLNLADIFLRERTETDVLIGIDFYNRLLFRERTVGGIALPEAVNSPFGWIVSGNIPSNDGGRECITLLVKTENEYGEDDLRRFWDLEIIGVTDDKGAKDPFVSRLMKTFEETLEYGDGRYTVKLPWKPGFLNLSNNYTHALQRLFKTEASLLKDTTKSEMYSKTLKEYMTEDRSPEFQAEVRKSAHELHVQAKTEAVLDVQKYSSLTKLLNVTAYVLRFITICKITPEERKSSTCEKSIKRNNSG